MSERPILFSAPMVLAILAGQKTQTRRLAKPQPVDAVTLIGADNRPTGEFGMCLESERVITKRVRCPYGRPGDRLWVREAWSYYGGDEYLYQQEPCSVGYRADHVGEHILGGRWRSSIYMPRWASRINLDITGVRLERVQDISERDAEAEGVVEWATNGGSSSVLCVDMFRDLWVDINGADSWESNPWVWVIDFRRSS